MSAVAAAIVVTGVAGAAIGSSASQSAADTQAAAAAYQADVSRDIYEQQKEVAAPYVAAGEAGQNRLLEYLGIGGSTGAQDYGKYATAEFTPDQFLAGQDPAYAFRMSEGLKALDRSAAARGGLLSGGTLKGIEQYGQGLASEEYQNAFNRYQATRTNTLAPYQSLQGVGQAAAAGQAANLGSLGSNLQAASSNAANASAAGTIGSANAWSSGLTGGVSSYMNYSNQQNMLNALNTANAQSAVNASYNAGLGTIY
jgi:hypothetical protein